MEIGQAPVEPRPCVVIHLANVVTLARYAESHPDMVDSLFSSVAEPFRSRALGSSHPNERLRKLASGLLLARVLGVTDAGRLSYGPYGKPRLSQGAPAFNLSHGGDYVALAVAAPDSGLDEVGVDVERVDGYERSAAHRVLTSEQCAWIESSRELAPWRFALLWTRLEATLKAEGTGFALDPREEGLPRGWTCTTVAWDGHLITCAAHREPSLEVRLHELPSS